MLRSTTMRTTKLHAKATDWARSYKLALKQHLSHGAKPALDPIAGLGRKAVALGLETLDLALIHEQAVKALIPPGDPSITRQRMARQANLFFAKTILPIEKTHRDALSTRIHLQQLTQTLRKRTMESSTSTRRLERGIEQRLAAETALRQSGKNHSKLLAEASRLKKCLRDQLRIILSDQEAGRKKASRHLHNEIAQTLLAINLRLLTLKKSIKNNRLPFEKEIAETQRLVQQSIKPIHRFAHEFTAHP